MKRTWYGSLFYVSLFQNQLLYTATFLGRLRQFWVIIPSPRHTFKRCWTHCNMHCTCTASALAGCMLFANFWPEVNTSCFLRFGLPDVLAGARTTNKQTAVSPHKKLAALAWWRHCCAMTVIVYVDGHDIARRYWRLIRTIGNFLTPKL